MLPAPSPVLQEAAQAQTDRLYFTHTIVARLDFSLCAPAVCLAPAQSVMCECAQHEDLQGALRCPDQSTIKTYCCRTIARRDSMGDK
jgi:hypothetical protein